MTSLLADSTSPRGVQPDPASERDNFISEVVRVPDFRRSGTLYGQSGHVWWAVVDPFRHQLSVWVKSGSGIFDYSRSAQALNSALFTNGPMMGKRLGPRRKMTRGLAVWEFVKWSMLGGLGGLVISYRSRVRYGGAVAGAGLGMLNAWRQAFTDWVPCGGVFGQDEGIHDRRNFDDEGKRHVWFGRFREDFASYRIGSGDLPDGIQEGVGGLIPLVRHWQPVSDRRGDKNFNVEFANLWQKQGVIGWGLVPFEKGDGKQTGRQEGVLAVVGSRTENLKFAADLLCAIGSRDAVATDQRGMIMMGAGRHMMIGPPSAPRQTMQLYGLCCRSWIP
jgi:hypothetical protein